MSRLTLGFGTASILGRVGERQSVAALTSAYDLGIRHFDTARSYGWGEAEGLVGRVLSRCPRDSYTLVTKCGLVPIRNSRLFSMTRQIARPIYRRLGVGQSVMKRAVSTASLQPSPTSDVAALRASLDLSLRALRTDYVDTLLLHNFVPGQPLDDVVEWFRKEREAGRIRRYGFSVEGDLHESLEYLESHGALDGALVQAPVSDQLLAWPDRWRTVAVTVHSLFRFLTTHAGTTPVQLLQHLSSLDACEAAVIAMFSRAHQVENLRALGAIAPSAVCSNR